MTQFFVDTGEQLHIHSFYLNIFILPKIKPKKKLKKTQTLM